MLSLTFAVFLKSPCRNIHLPKTCTEANGETTKDFSIFNTINRQKEVFKPRVAGKVSMYVCGITAYDFSHIGHARVYVTFDVLHRYLKHLGYEVTYVRNFTDIDDKIINRAKELGEDPIQLSDRFCHEFQNDMASLQCLTPSIEPRVSKFVDKIVQMISQIVANGYGYVISGGDVYFSLDAYATKFAEYGRLSGRKLEDNRAGERVAVDERKRNPGDFVLWKTSKPDQPSWSSPWGPGRPGWHIECSAMSVETLGDTFDIHGGGMDLIFPHHENEIAQSKAACKDSNVTYWMHNGFVNVDSEKMSKSLGNFFTIREVLKSYHPLALRWFLLGTHYRSPVNYSQAQLETASDRTYYLYQTLLDSETCVKDSKSKEKASKEATECVEKYKECFASSMADDLHTPLVIGELCEALKLMNELLHTKKGRKDKTRCASLEILQEEVKKSLEVLGLGVESYGEVLKSMKMKALRRAEISEADLEAQIQDRTAARATKDYARSDEIRRKLSQLGIALMDEGDQTLWRPAAAVSPPSPSQVHKGA